MVPDFRTFIKFCARNLAKFCWLIQFVANIGYLTWESPCFPADVEDVTHWLCEWQWQTFQISVGRNGLGSWILGRFTAREIRPCSRWSPGKLGSLDGLHTLQKMHLYLGFQFRSLVPIRIHQSSLLSLEFIYTYIACLSKYYLNMLLQPLLI